MKFLKITSFLTAIIMIAMISMVIIINEKDKKIRKLQEINNNHLTQLDEFINYKKEYDAQVKKMIAQNQTQMLDAKNQYETLLKQQPSLIAEHTKNVQQSVVSTQPSTVNNQSNTKRQTVTVTKPKPSTSTKSS